MVGEFRKVGELRPPPLKKRSKESAAPRRRARQPSQVTLIATLACDLMATLACDLMATLACGRSGWGVWGAGLSAGRVCGVQG